jgi:hypothetical protein
MLVCRAFVVAALSLAFGHSHGPMMSTQHAFRVANLELGSAARA